MKIIINSDDFGLTVPVNDAILESFKAGVISDTTMLVNKEGFDDAMQKIASNEMLGKRIGLHINLTDGRPLTDAIKKCHRFCDTDGMYIYTRSSAIWSLTADEKKAVYGEVKAQLEKCTAHGLRLSHIDSHHHVHTEWGILGICLQAAKESGINKVRLTRNIGSHISTPKKMYKAGFNFYIKNFAGFKSVQYFGDLDDLAVTGTLPSQSTLEIMVHAMYNDTGEIVDYNQKPLFDAVRKLLAQNQLISYSDL
jgi:predicted glycoside hydrolase/deacetylase ChbG (UPF0249 family)